MFATVHAAGSSFLGLFNSCTTFDSTGEARGQGTRRRRKKKRRTHVAIEASRHSERTLATWHRMLREGIT
eukprot:scaffold19922_cov120-Isochrysis_galbana.AAC.7